MAWCDVVEPRTLREYRIALGQSQAAFAAMLGVSPESYRTWDAGRRATPLKILARARALATHRDDHANFRVCTDKEIALLSDADPGNNPPQSGCIYEDQALIRPDTTINYEAGVRRSWRDGRFSANGTLFHVDWEDIQVTGLTSFSSQPITLNGGGAVSRGVELAGAAGLTNALRFRGSWSYTHAELSQDSPGLLEDGADAFEGDRLSGAPRQQGSLLASFGVLLGGGTALELLYGYTYIGDVLTRIGLRAGGETLPAYDLHNLSAAVSKGDWTVTFYVDNLLDEYAVTGVRQTPGLIGVTDDGFRSRRYFANVLAPQRAGVRLRYTFQ